MATLGERLRELRLLRNLTLKEIAEQTSLSVSFLSLVERDKVSISVDHLERLARCYSVRLVNLFQGLQDDTILVTRKDQALKQLGTSLPGKSNFLLLSQRSGARMEPLLIQIGPGHGDDEYRSLDADMFVFVISGCLRLFSEKADTVELHGGDSAYFFGFPGHRFENASQTEPALILIVTTPPSTLRDDILDNRRGVLLQSEF